MTIDDYLFDPCGYSMNGVLKGGEYMTIHITPEAEFSYVSFESNIQQSSYLDVIKRVLDTFRPGKFIVTAFANKVLNFSRFRFVAGILYANWISFPFNRRL